MKPFLKAFLFLICLFSSVSLSATLIDDYTTFDHQAKLYFTANEVEISDNVIYLHLENTLIGTDVLRTDSQGFYIFENDITHYETRDATKEWKCPYCYAWWPIGQKCQNPNCPVNQW